MKKMYLRILIIIGILILVAATGVVAEYAGFYAVFANIPIIALIVVLVKLFMKK
jgi:hypothetical protein